MNTTTESLSTENLSKIFLSYYQYIEDNNIFPIDQFKKILKENNISLFKTLFTKSLYHQSIKEIKDYKKFTNIIWAQLNKFPSETIPQIKDFKNILGQSIILSSELMSGWSDYKSIVLKNIEDVEHKYKEYHIKEFIQDEIKNFLEENIALNKTIFYQLKEEKILNNKFLKNIILKRTLNYLTIKNQDLLKDDLIKIKKIRKLNEALAQHLEKTALNQACLNLFKKENKNFEELFYNDIITSKSELSQLIEIPIQNNQIAFVYISSQTMAKPIIPRNGALINPHNGKNYAAIEIFHFDKNFEIPCQILEEDKKVLINFKIGVILAEEISEKTSSIVDINKVIKEALNKSHKNYSNKEVSNHAWVNKYIHTVDLKINQYN